MNVSTTQSGVETDLRSSFDLQSQVLLSNELKYCNDGKGGSFLTGVSPIVKVHTLINNPEYSYTS